jgi:hypothetical protein
MYPESADEPKQVEAMADQQMTSRPPPSLGCKTLLSEKINSVEST